MERPSVRERLRYAFDNFMSKGTVALLIGLFAISIAIISLAAVFVQVTGAASDKDPPIGFWTLLWRNMLRTLDPGTMGGDVGSALFLATMLAVTIGGIFVISALIGVISSGIETKLSELRKGRSRVLERGHTVILGWSREVFTVIGELVVANANQPRSLIVVLADRDKVEMEDEIRTRVPNTRSTRIVCRHGSPMDLDELDIANIQSSRAVIVLSPEVEDPDPDVLKILLAVVNDPNRRPEPYHVVAEIQKTANVGVAHIIGRDEVELILVDQLISRITAQTCRQSGLSTVYTELLDFAGDEIYFTSEPSLVGRPFGEALAAYEDSAVIGIHNGSAALNPPMDTVIQETDKLIVIAEDDHAIRLSSSPHQVPEHVIREARPIQTTPERTLLLGWNRRAASVIAELDHYVPPGSTMTVVADLPQIDAAAGELQRGMTNASLTCRKGDTTDRALLDSLDLPGFDHVIVLCYSDSEDPQRADARTLATLLHLRDIASRSGARFSITSEMLDVRNRTLAEATKADDFIVSDRLVSLMMAQIAENKHLSSVFRDLLDEEGSEIYLRPVEDYVSLEQPVDFYTVVEAARRRSEVALGYRRAALADDAASAYGVVVNPRKSDSVHFANGDQVIVLAGQ